MVENWLKRDDFHAIMPNTRKTRLVVLRVFGIKIFCLDEQKRGVSMVGGVIAHTVTILYRDNRLAVCEIIMVMEQSTRKSFGHMSSTWKRANQNGVVSFCYCNFA